MKKLLIILLSVFSLTVFAQNQKIALLEPRTGDGSAEISGMEKAMVRGELRKAIVNHTGFEAFTRGDIDQMLKEQDFQRTGNVSEADIHKLGEMSGADYICVSTLNKSADEFYLEAYLINVETGAISNPASQYGELVNGKLANMLPVCQALAQELLGTTTPVAQSVMTPTPNSPQRNVSSIPAPTNNIPVSRSVAGYVDLGLPSGTLWKEKNEECGFINYQQAMSMYGNELPTFVQVNELFTHCTWTWTNTGFIATGPNNTTIFFPVEGYKDILGATYKNGAMYWSSTPADSNATTSAKEMERTGGLYGCLLFAAKKASIGVFWGKGGGSIRLVK